MIKKAARDIGLFPRFPFLKLASGESHASPDPDEQESDEESEESEEHELESLSPPTVSPPQPPSPVLESLVSDEQDSELELVSPSDTYTVVVPPLQPPPE